MLIPRVIPCLLLDRDEMVKTIGYQDARYIGDPVNIINLFNQFEVDEIVLLDIGATQSGRSPDIRLIRELAEECWVPLAYGGGITTEAQVREILGVGIEKVVLGTAAAENPSLVTEIADTFGVQAVVVSVDAQQTGPGTYDTVIRSASMSLGVAPADHAHEMERRGAGEILLNAVDRDGMMDGYDLALIGSVADAVGIPVIAACGAGTRDDLARPIKEANASAVAAGSLFVYSGAARGVLVNFPERGILERILA